MRKIQQGSMGLLILAAAAVQVQGTTVYTESYDTDHTANWNFIPGSSVPTDLPNDVKNNDANVFFDYSTLGIPSAPGSTGGSTVGMKFVPNLGVNGYPTTGVVGNGTPGLTLTANSQSFDFANRDYKVSAQVWMNYYGSTGSGTTIEVAMGVGGSVNGSQIPYDASATPGPTKFNGVLFSTATDGDTTTTDYRAYKNPFPATSTTDPTPAIGRVQQGDSGVYAAGTALGASGSMDSANSFYQSLFPVAVVPQAQQDAFPLQQTGLQTTGGVPAFAWHTWTITTTHGGGPIVWAIDGTTIATIAGGTTNPYTLGGGSIFFGAYDINTTPPPAGVNADKLLFGLVDNVKVEDLSPKLVGDTNGDGHIDLTDLNNVLNNFGATGTGNPGDDNSDGHVDLTDLNDVLNNFGASAPSGVLGAVPEPGAISLLGMAAVGLIRRRRRNR